MDIIEYTLMLDLLIWGPKIFNRMYTKICGKNPAIIFILSRENVALSRIILNKCKDDPISDFLCHENIGFSSLLIGSVTKIIIR